MRASLLYNPADVIERLGLAITRRRRRRCLRGTPAEALGSGYLTSLELLGLLRKAPPAVIYDIGAHIGTWTCLAKSLYPRARVEAFEPLSIHFERFREWTAPWPDVRLHACALGAYEGSATMHVMDITDASSLLPVTAEGLREFGVRPKADQPVPVHALDGLVSREGLQPPNLIKLDVQGYELEVLRGAAQCMRSAQAVLCEVSVVAYYSGQPLFPEVLAFLREHGFRLHAFANGTPLGEPLAQVDALFTKP